MGTQGDDGRAGQGARSLAPLILTGLSGGLAAALVLLLAVLTLWWSGVFGARGADAETADAIAFPGQAAIEEISCGQGETRLVIMHGREDNFSPEGEEPAIVRPRLLESPYHASLVGTEGPHFKHRDYDEGGADKLLIDSFELPRGILSGAVVLSARNADRLATNDGVTIGDLYPVRGADGMVVSTGYNAPIAELPRTATAPVALKGLLVFPLEAFGRSLSGAEGAEKSLIGFLNSPARPDTVDVTIEDDTQVDFFAFVLCLKPDMARGTTFREFHEKTLAPDLSHLTCSSDYTQPVCNADSGDFVCTGEIPLFCYREGERARPSDFDKVQHAGSRSSEGLVGGEVRVSRPVIPPNLATLEQANAVCTGEFGPGWRVATFHEGGGHDIYSRSTIEPKTRALIHVGDSPWANCWDRPDSRDGE